MTEMDAMNVMVKGHRPAVLPKWRGKHGDRAKGSVKWSRHLRGWNVIHSYLIGYESTMQGNELYISWRLAMGSYREHDRTVQEKRRLEKYRNSSQYGLEK